jgi:hypothetical protein
MKNFSIILILLLTILVQSTQARSVRPPDKNSIAFEIEIDSGIAGSPIIILYENAFYNSGNKLAEQQEYSPTYSNGRRYKFLIPGQDGPRNFNIMAKTEPPDQHFLSFFVLEPGDNIIIQISRGTRAGDFKYIFSGTGAAKYTCRQSLQYVNHMQKGIEILEQYRAQMSTYSYQLLRTDMMSRIWSFRLTDQRYKMLISDEKGDTITTNVLKREYLKTYAYLDVHDISQEILYNSAGYLDDLSITNYVKNGSGKYLLLHSEIASLPDRGLRDRLFVKFFINNWKKLKDNYEDLLDRSIKLTTDKYCQNKLQSFLHIANGVKAFNFSLQDATGKVVRLADFKGKAVLIDIYFTGCAYCRLYYKHILSDVEKQYLTNQDIVFVSVSIDKDKNKWLETSKMG